MQLLRSLIGTNVRLYFDNLFTTPSLIFKLKQDQIHSCVTVRQNRKGMPKNLKKDKEMKRGELDRRQLEGMHLVKWMDTKGVIVLSTIDSSMPVVPVRRRLKGQKEKVTIQCPLMVKTCNNGMKGTDLMDQLKTSYEVDRRYLKKFYLRVFFDFMDISYVNAFIVYKKYMQDKFPHSARLKTLKDFKHDAVMDLIGEFSSRKQARSSSTVVSRFSSNGSDIHQVTRVSYQDRGRCKLCTKRKIDSRTCTRCDDCNLFLCQTSKKNCFREWHFGVESNILV